MIGRISYEYMLSMKVAAACDTLFQKVMQLSLDSERVLGSKYHRPWP